MNVVVLAPYQVWFQGTVYLPGEKVRDVPDETAENWILNGWAEEAIASETKAPTKPAARK
jgi:hypothetical protein